MIQAYKNVEIGILPVLKFKITCLIWIYIAVKSRRLLVFSIYTNLGISKEKKPPFLFILFYSLVINMHCLFHWEFTLKKLYFFYLLCTWKKNRFFLKEGDPSKSGNWWRIRVSVVEESYLMKKEMYIDGVLLFWITHPTRLDTFFHQIKSFKRFDLTKKYV